MVFKDDYWFLSNFYNCKVKWKGYTLDSSEALFQALKSRNWTDFKKFIGLTPSQAKKLGNVIDIRPDWDRIRIDVMRAVLRAKFLDPANVILAKKLLATNNIELIEDNYWNDTFWGKCNGVGENHLGKLLMELREEIKNN